MSRRRRPRKNKGDLFFDAPYGDAAPRKRSRRRPKQTKAARQFGKTAWALVAWAVVTLVLPAIACLSYKREGLAAVLGAAGLSIIAWIYILRSDLALKGIRHARPLVALVIVVICQWALAAIFIGIVIQSFYDSLGYKAVAIALGLPAPMWYVLYQHVRIIRDRVVTASSRTEIDRFIEDALRTMDATARSYESEEAANKELATTLKALNRQLVVEYQPKISEGTTADVRIGDVLIEGKLNLLNIDDGDRLIGQLRRYCRDSRYQVKVVVYGRVNHRVWEHVDRERRDTYELGRVRLIHLPHPHRTARESVVGPNYSISG